MSDSNVTQATNTTDPCGDSVPLTLSLENRPQQDVLRYRTGTHPLFYERMLRALPLQTIPDGANQGTRPLALLTTRSTEDPAIALLDACAVVADVVSFYQERIINEGFLRTATERRSLLELSRAVGYELHPGAAASAYLAFTVDDAAGAPGKATVPIGCRILSIPGQNERPQTFETIEWIETRVEWNAMTPRQTEAQSLGLGTQSLVLNGVNTQLLPGDGILIVEKTGSEVYAFMANFALVSRISTNPKAATTTVTLDRPLVNIFGSSAEVMALRQRANIFGYNAPDWDALPQELQDAYDPANTATEWPGLALSNAQTIDLDTAYPRVRSGGYAVLVRPASDSATTNDVNNCKVNIYKLVTVQPAARVDFTLAAKTTRIKLSSTVTLSADELRQTQVLTQSEVLPLAEQPLSVSLSNLDPQAVTAQVQLSTVVPGLRAGQRLIATGKRMRVLVTGTGEGLYLSDPLNPNHRVALHAGNLLFVATTPTISSGQTLWTLTDIYGFTGTLRLSSSSSALQLMGADSKDEFISELLELTGAEDDGPQSRTTLIFKQSPRNFYDRTTLAFNANIALATHGESVQEAIGSGDGSVAFQAFQLRRNPLTFIAAPTEKGVISSLQVKVNQVQWTEIESLLDAGPNDRVYTVQLDDSGIPLVQFGDGVHGARLPTGQENVVASYRWGLGTAGNLAPGKLALMQTRPLGIRSVVNPLSASGGTSPEALNDARSNAPVSTHTLGRLVSSLDFSAFAISFAGIAKATASTLRGHRGARLFVTVAGDNAAPVEQSSALYQNLLSAMQLAAYPGTQVKLASFAPLYFNVAAGLILQSGYLAEAVLPIARERVLTAYSFSQRSLGQAVESADIIALLQATPGVKAVVLNALYLSTYSPSLSSTLRALPARVSGQLLAPAQLLMINSDSAGIALSEAYL